MSDLLTILRKLDSIGPDAEDTELAYHLGDEAIVELLEAETEGLVESKTYFTLTERGGGPLEGGRAR